MSIRHRFMIVHTTVAPRDFIPSKDGQHKLCSEAPFSPKVAKKMSPRDYFLSQGGQQKLSREISFSPLVATKGLTRHIILSISGHKRIATTHHFCHQWPTKLIRDTSLSSSVSAAVIHHCRHQWPKPQHIIVAISGLSCDTSLSPSAVA